MASTSTNRDEYGNEITPDVNTPVGSNFEKGNDQVNEFNSEQFRQVILNTQWADVSETESGSAAASGDESEEGESVESFEKEGEYLDLDQHIDISKVTQVDFKSCKCCCPQSIISCINLMKEMAELTPSHDDQRCILNNIIFCYNMIFSKRKNPIDHYKIAYTDFFFRLRHEILFKLFCQTFNFPVGKSDRPFSDFGLDSVRTPDLIIEQSGIIYIFEITATSGVERAAVAKGMEQMGFESKYSKEIRQLNDKGISNVYLPLFFDMSDPNSVINTEQINEIQNIFNVNNFFKSLLRQVARQLSIISNNIKQSLITSSAILFTKNVKINSNHPNWEFLYSSSSDNNSSSDKNNNKINKVKTFYKDLTVSTQVYKKITSSTDRLYNMIDNSKFTDSELVSIVLDVNSNQIKIEKNKDSVVTLNDIRQILMDNNVIELFKAVMLKVNNNLLSCLNSDTGVKFIERTSSIEVDKEFEKVPEICDHPKKFYSDCEVDLNPYHDRVEEFNSQEIKCNIIDYSYEDRIFSAIKDLDESGQDYSNFDFGSRLLGQMQSKEVDIDKVFEPIKKDFITANQESQSIPVIKLKMKAPFILPLAELNSSSYGKLDYKNEFFINKIIEFISESNPYTTLILRGVLNTKYLMYSEQKLETRQYRELLNERSEISNSINHLQRKLYKSKPKDGITQLSKSTDPNFRIDYLNLAERFKSINKEIMNRRKLEGAGKDISYVRLPTKNKKSHLRSLYNQEVEHFKNKRYQSTIEGVGIISTIEDDHARNTKIYHSIVNLLNTDCGNNPDPVIDFTETDDVKLLKELKQIAKDEYKDLINDVKDSYLGHASALVSRLAHTLLYLSQLPFSSDYIRVDNLGYKNVLLIVKGGKKIFKSKASKFFRLVYPISDVVSNWFKGHSRESSSILFNIGDQKYCITPWAMLHENIITDSISFYPRVVSFTVLNLNPNLKFRDQSSKVSFNVLLGFHNRRQTESLLANMRYILLSTMGDFNGIQEILPEFFSFNYDSFQSYIRSCILMNYPGYFKAMQDIKSQNMQSGKDITESKLVSSRIKNLFTDDVIDSTEDLAMMIYSTFLMTKAPYQKLVERANNLKGILKIHDTYINSVGDDISPEEQMKKIGVELKDNYIDYSKELFSNDFNFDPKYCALVGNFMDSYFKNSGLTDALHSEWIKILNQSWDELARSTGLRGDYEKIEDFWGKKGYFVVYKELLSNHDFKNELSRILFDEVSDDQKRKQMRGINETYNDKIESDREFLIFHAVDKSQWRGSREIYVMDITTKTLQQPIEKYMGFICSNIDNELISVPSDRRAQLIHHAIFEKDIPLKDMMNWYLTLDCSKWAPKSIFTKFSIAINNISSIPNSFKIHLLNYFEKLYKKRIYFNEGEVKVLINNSNYKSICEKYLKKDTKVNGYYLEMKYSWVMGIFNYMSSFLHAANQKYFSYLLMRSSIQNVKEECTITMFAHSDDSGGRLCVSSNEMAVRALCLYEINLKCCNHLLSRKKSVVSRIYFEILSIIYIFNKLLALLSKFLGGLRFLPTDKGPCQDMLQSYSKSIEILIAGGSFNVAYLVMKFYSSMVWRFYFNREITKLDYKRPVQYLGVPDSHPIMVLLCGSDSDICRLMVTGEDLPSQIAFSNTLGSVMDGEGPIKPYKFLIKVKGLNKGFEPYLEHFDSYLQKWSVRNVNFHTTGMNVLGFLRKLKDPGFIGSLVNESTVRRISRSYFIRSGFSTITSLGNIKLKGILDSLQLFQKFINKEDSINMLLSDILGEKNINELKEELNSNLEPAKKQIDLLWKALNSPIRVMKYMDNISMADKKIVEIKRTLKPTHVQLVKSNRIFSVDFDPASLVSLVKEPEMKWSLNNLKNIFTAQSELEDFCYKMGFDIDSIDPDMLLRICRSYGRENVKNIYLYSRVPSEIRQIKTYSAFLTFISVNTYNDKEIEGLVLKVNEKEVGKEYLSTNIDQEIYLINNIVNLIYILSMKCDPEFILKITIKPVIYISEDDCTISDFLVALLDKVDEVPELAHLKCPLYSICKIIGLKYFSPKSFYSGSFYTFLKSQRSRSGWYGKGEVFINIDNMFYSFRLDNKNLESVYTNKKGKIKESHVNFILDVLTEIDINFRSMKRPKNVGVNDYYFGHDMGRGFSILPGREITSGIPARIIGQRNEFVDYLDLFEIKEIVKDSIIIEKTSEFDSERRKLHFLPIKKSEISNIIPTILYKEQFEEKMDEMGLNDFEEFVLTEILTEYGQDVYVDLNTVFDNFISSKIYNIFRQVHKNSWSKLPVKITESILPSPEGSISRILIDYTDKTKDKVLKTPSNLNPQIMKIRSEFPESMSVILSENLVKCHKNIYNNSELSEIENHYSQIYSSDDLNTVRLTLIKLMTYWGYGSLVNTIEKFNISKKEHNYFYFNLRLKDKKYIGVYSNLFEDLFNSVKEVWVKWAGSSQKVETPIPRLESKYGMMDALNGYCFSLVFSLYKFESYGMAYSLNQLLFLNYFIGLLGEEEFCSELQQKLSNNYILSSIMCNYKSRSNFIIMFNTLSYLWCLKNNQKYVSVLRFDEKLSRIPDNVVNFKSFLDKFIKINLKDIYYGGFLNSHLHSYLISSREVKTDSIIYRVTSSVKHPSSTSVIMTELTKFKRPLNQEYIDSETYDELVCECTMTDLDEDTIQDLLDSEDKRYNKKKTKYLKVKGSSIVKCHIDWIIDPYISNKSGIINYYRQVGENIIVLTNCLIPGFVKNYPESGVRLVNFGKLLGVKSQPMLAYYSLDKKLNKPGFLEKYIGGEISDITIEDVNITKLNQIRDSDGSVVNCRNIGRVLREEDLLKEHVNVDNDGIITRMTKEEYEKMLEKKRDEEVKKAKEEEIKINDRRNKIMAKASEQDVIIELKRARLTELMNSLREKGEMSKEVIDKLEEQYLIKLNESGMNMEIIFESIMTKYQMLMIDDSIKNNNLSLTSDQQKKMFMAPEHFSMAYSMSKGSGNPIKDKHLRSEIDSFHPGISSNVGSCTLRLSKKFRRLIAANYKLWEQSVKGTEYKKDNKRFLLTVFLSLVNNTASPDDPGDDHVWQDIVNKVTMYISDIGDSEDDLEETLGQIFGYDPGSRLKYRPYAA